MRGAGESKVRFPYPVDLRFFAEEKTEPPTPRRREEARRKGQVARSHDLTVALSLLFAVFLISAGQRPLAAALASLFRRGLALSPGDTLEEGLRRIAELALPVGLLGGSFLLALFAFGILASAAQTGFVLSSEAVGFDLGRINPVQGLRRIFSLRSLVYLAFALLKSAGAVALAVFLFRGLLREVRVPPDVETATAELTGASFRLLWSVGGLFLALALLDFAYQRFEHERGLRMSRTELKEELRKTEGDPLLRSRQRERMRSLARSRMIHAVPRADVVVTNPTHVAVALRYEARAMQAPTVVAKGKGVVALRIREVAEEHGVPLVERPPLARLLYDRVPLGAQIPPDLYRAVAEVLAYAYRIRGRNVGERG
ncbi:MAG: EscU/YscU/HrcU family type III secretion system export apparatus switch protein [Brockia lithotrophica]|nr:EscU/YscU/HrcU family type III secretion system export apparatus switch protein [Brockia lithotrophica]